MQATNWREERRRDRMADAQIGRENETARAQARLAESETQARLNREHELARAADRKTARRQRTARRAERTAWLRAHVTDLLFAPVIVVPGVLAWSAMAAYGHDLYGMPGYALPAFSEGAMWAFEARATWTVRQHPERPVWHLQAGSLFFAGVGAALNFLHGVTVIPGHPHGVTAGAVMAIISAAGLVAHQLVNLGPRQSRAQRAAVRADRAIARRERAIRRAAMKRATAVLDADGNARLVHSPGAVTVTRRRGRVRLGRVYPERTWLPWPMVLPGAAETAAGMLLDAQAAEAVIRYRDWHSVVISAPATVREPRPLAAPEPRPRTHPVPVLAPAASAPRIAPGSAASGAPDVVSQVHPAAPQSAPGALRPGAPASAPEKAPKRSSRRTPKTVSDAAAERHFAAEIAAGRVPSERQIKRDLHVGQERAKAIREHLVQRRVVVPMRQAR